MMKARCFFSTLLLMGFLTSISFGQNARPYIQLSQDLLMAVKTGEDTRELEERYAELSVKELEENLRTQNEKLAFWINTYNAFIQITLSRNPELYGDRGSFFKKERLTIAGIEMSFDDLEHSLMRNSSNKLSGGYLKQWFEPKWVCKLRNEEIDGRIHFALNCGAISCPPVAIYSAENLDQELDKISERYLTDHTRIEGDEVHTTALFSWFRGDFGGLSGVKDFLRQYDIIPNDHPANLEFNDYDWTMSLGNYIEW